MGVVWPAPSESPSEESGHPLEPQPTERRQHKTTAMNLGQTITLRLLQRPTRGKLTVGNMKALFTQKALYSSIPILPPAAFPALPARGGAAGRRGRDCATSSQATDGLNVPVFAGIGAAEGPVGIGTSEKPNGSGGFVVWTEGWQIGSDQLFAITLNQDLLVLIHRAPFC